MSQQPNLLDDDDRVVDIDISTRMEQAFLDYSMSVIVGRALPDVRDGLKPVQRRILYAMWEEGLRPDRPYRKCASAVGDVMKKYHPHGDSSIYEALVRMGQDFSSRVPLIDGKGNFGSVDGDSAAAMRYTECRLSEAAMALLSGIDEDAVDHAPNYDGYHTEPVVLPSRLPNLLVNGASGIAVGMATSMPPHNLGEVIDGCLAMIARPSLTVDELMRHIPAPDFPTGARILDGAGVRDAYLTGRGAITVEAVAATETRSGGLPRIVITELPFQVNKSALLEKMADLVRAKKLEGIRDLRDESSRDGMRVVVELKRGEDPARTLDRLYRLTELRTNFNANMVALVPGDGGAVQPRTVGLVELLRHYLAHQRDVLTRRTRHRRDRAAARAHVLEGLLVALDHLDEVIALIRGSETVEAARASLIERFGLTEVQATAILDMQLRRLAALEREKIAAGHAELLALIADLDAILDDQAKLDRLLVDELKALRKAHADPRRSRIAGADAAGVTAADDEGAPSSTLEAQPITTYVTAGGYLKSVPARRISAAHSHPRDPVVAVLRATTDDTVLLVDADGGGYRIGLGDVPVTTMRQRGATVAQLLGEGPDAPIVGAVVLADDVASVLTVSGRGLVKRTTRDEYLGRTKAMIAAGVRDDDELVAALPCGDADHVLLAHDAGLVTRFPASDVRPMGRGAAGVAGMQVPTRARVVTATTVPDGAEEGEVITLATDGGARRSPLGEYPLKSRGGKGLQTGTATLAWCGLAADLQVPADDEVVVLRTVEPAQGRRAGVLTPATPAVTGRVVGEQRPHPPTD